MATGIDFHDVATAYGIPDGTLRSRGLLEHDTKALLASKERYTNSMNILLHIIGIHLSCMYMNLYIDSYYCLL